MNKVWDVSLAGVPVYNLLFYMLIFSFIGWLWESCYVSVMEHRIANRGYITGPLCTIYGVGGVFMTLTLSPFKDNYIVLFLLAIVFTTALEYVTAVIMEGIFHTSWWDYTMEKFNYKGRISLKSSLLWGFASLLLFKVLIPACDRVISVFSVKTGRVIICVAAGIYSIDFIFSTIAAVDVSAKIQKIDAVLDELEDYFKSTKLYAEGSELKNRMGTLRVRFTEINYISRYSKRIEVAQALLSDRIAQTGVAKYTVEVQGRIREFISRITFANAWNGLLQGRIFRAYPKIKSHRHFKEMQDEAENNRM